MIEVIPVVELVPVEYVRVWNKLRQKRKVRHRDYVIRRELKYGRGV